MVKNWLQRVHEGLMDDNTFYQNLMRLLRGNGYPGPKANNIYEELMAGKPPEAVMASFHPVQSGIVVDDAIASYVDPYDAVQEAYVTGQSSREETAEKLIDLGCSNVESFLRYWDKSRHDIGEDVSPYLEEAVSSFKRPIKSSVYTEGMGNSLKAVVDNFNSGAMSEDEAIKRLSDLGMDWRQASDFLHTNSDKNNHPWLSSFKRPIKSSVYIELGKLSDELQNYIKRAALESESVGDWWDAIRGKVGSGFHNCSEDELTQFWMSLRERVSASFKRPIKSGNYGSGFLSPIDIVRDKYFKGELDRYGAEEAVLSIWPECPNAASLVEDWDSEIPRGVGSSLKRPVKSDFNPEVVSDDDFNLNGEPFPDDGLTDEQREERGRRRYENLMKTPRPVNSGRDALPAVSWMPELIDLIGESNALSLRDAYMKDGGDNPDLIADEIYRLTGEAIANPFVDDLADALEKQWFNELEDSFEPPRSTIATTPEGEIISSVSPGGRLGFKMPVTGDGGRLTNSYTDLFSGFDSYIVSEGGGYVMDNFDVSCTSLDEIVEDLLLKFSRYNFFFKEQNSAVSFVSKALQDAYEIGMKNSKVFSAKASDRGKDKAELAVDEISERLESNLMKLLDKSSGSLSGSTFHVLCKNALLEAYMRGEWTGKWGDTDGASTVKSEDS